MIVLIDGKRVEVQNDVKIIYEDILCVTSDDEEYTSQLQVTLNCEGAIVDLYDEDGEECLRTAAIPIIDLEEMCQ